MTPRVSICIPAYNAQQHLAETLDSVWAQSFDDFEVVVVNDASTDATGEILRAQADPRFRYWDAPANGGQPRTTDLTLIHARGEFIKFLDADDPLYPDCLAKMVASLDAHPSASFTFCRRDVLADQDDEDVVEAWMKLHGDLHTGFPPLSEINDGQRLLELWIRSGMDDNWIAEPAGVMARRTSLQRVGGYSHRVRLTVDMDLWARLMTCGDVAFIDEPLYRYRFAIAGNTGGALQGERNWLDGLWAAEGLLALDPAPDLPALRKRRRQLLLKATRVAASELRSRPVRTAKSKDLASYAKYRMRTMLGRPEPIFRLPPATPEGG
jgi:glycosyltransferase involved in cell wall biosynthesis